MLELPVFASLSPAVLVGGGEGSFEKGFLEKGPFSRGSGDFRDSRERERFWRISGDLRDSRDSREAPESQLFEELQSYFNPGDPHPQTPLTHLISTPLLDLMLT